MTALVTAFRLAAALGIPVLVGWMLLDRFFPSKSDFGPIERLALGWGLGCGTVSLSMLMLAFLGVPFDALGITAILAVSVAIVRAIGGSRRPHPPPRPSPALRAGSAPGALRIALLAALALAFALVFVRTLLVEIDLWDTWAMWAYKAKIFFVHRTIPWNRLDELKTTFGHWDYPVHVPLLETWVLLFLGQWNDQLPRILFPLFHVALCASVFCFLRRRVPVEAALLGAFCFATLNGLQQWVIGNMVEPMLIYYFTAGLMLLDRWMREGGDRFLVLAGLFAGFAGWTKNDGLALFLSTMFSLTVFLVVEHRRRPGLAAAAWIRYVAVGSLVVLPWTLVKKFAHLGNDVISGRNLDPSYLAAQLHRLAELPAIFMRHFADVEHWNILWPAFLLVMIVRGRWSWRARLGYLILPMVVQVAVDCALYVMWPHETDEFRDDTLQRLLLAPAAAAILFIVNSLFMEKGPSDTRAAAPMLAADSDASTT